jgi:hypothetical protein
LFVVVDVGAWKTEVSLLQNTAEGLRELRTVGSPSISMNQICRGAVDLLLPQLKSETPYITGRDIAALYNAIAAAIWGDHCVKLTDIVDGEQYTLYEHEFAESEIQKIVDPVAARLKELVESVVTNEHEQFAVKHVECIGGGTNLKGFETAVRSAFPDAEFRQANADEIVAAGAALDAAQVTKRLEPGLSTRVVVAAPYTIGTAVVGGIVSFMIHRGEPLPAVGFKHLALTSDPQESMTGMMTIAIFQGEHFVAGMNNRIGDTLLTGLPRRHRAQMQGCCRVECDENGILQFSAEEPSTGSSLHAQFTAKHEFTEDDFAQMKTEWTATSLEERKRADLLWIRAKFQLDIERARAQADSPDVVDAGRQWAEWFAENARARASILHSKWREALGQFYELNPDGWDAPETTSPCIRFIPMWPVAPTFVSDGSAIIHFLVDPAFPDVYAKATNIATDEVVRADDRCQVIADDGMIETFIRIAFPANGRYLVRAYAAPKSGVMHFSFCAYGCVEQVWKFDVEGAPSANRPLPSLMAGWKTGKMRLPDGFMLRPSDWCLDLDGLEHKFSCKFRGEKLLINGRELEGEPKRTFWAKLTPMAVDDTDPMDAGWLAAEATVTCPGQGVWRLMFFVDGKYVLTQFVITNEAPPINLNTMEAAAISAKNRG